MIKPIRAYLFLLLAIASVVWYSSCDVFAYNSYTIQNNADTSIIVEVFRKTHSKVSDSVFVIARDSTAEVHLAANRMLRGYKQKPHDIILEFDSIVVIKRGGRSSKDLLNNDSWNFTKKVGSYKAEINNIDF